MKRESVGTVETRCCRFEGELLLEGGGKLKELTLAYETYGTLNREKSNAILVCHALTGDAHAAGWHAGDKKPGWWDSIIGPGKALDTEKYFMVCSNVLGGCKGSTGPASINPETGTPYGMNFPVITIGDMVHAQKKLVEHLGISRLFAVVGGSMGGMQVLQWAVSYPDMVEKAVAIATTATSSAQHIAFNEVGRLAIISDPDWKGGNYPAEAPPAHGLAIARMIGHITYLSDESMHRKFGRELQDKEEYAFDFSRDFAVQSYLHHQGSSFTGRFDANSYLYITKAVDYFDLSRNGSLIEGFGGVKAAFLVISVSSDWLYPPYQSKAIVSALSAANVEVTYREIESHYGHDAFLLEAGQLNYLLHNFLSRLCVSDVMAEDVITIGEGSSIEDAACTMFREGITNLPVVSEKPGKPDEKKLVGIVTAWDITRAFALKCRTLDEIMTKEVITANPEEAVETAARKMDFHRISALPVVDGEGRLLGIVGDEAINRFIGRF
ncbi:TPA: homoserine O-acetyltransferase [Methanosarcinaceae archaeon]|nr:homoserine O-acetyltransferase [Methanosarcinaceae archaeon]